MTVHQLLHGYDEGHTLLGASRPLAPEAARRALVLSDLSGAATNPAFDGYLTGYPLPGEGAYALARTWYAPEMPRPGCVWTHTLLVDFADLAVLHSPSVLLELFARPGLHLNSYERYGTELVVPSAEAAPRRKPGSEQDDRTATALLRALYVSDDGRDLPPVALVRSSAGPSEKLLLSVWAQQWPRLRRSFSFCTGALELRAPDGVLLDVQVTPDPRSARKWPEARILKGEPEDSGTSSERGWLQRAVADLSAGPEGAFRLRLRQLGADVPGERWVFAALAETVVLLDAEPAVHDRIRHLADAFPIPTEAPSLKALLLGADSFTVTEEAATLLALLTTPWMRSFDERGIDVFGRVERLWMTDRPSGLSLLGDLLEAEPNAWGTRVALRLVELATTRELVEILSRRGEALPAILAQRPEILHEPSLWAVRAVREPAAQALQGLDDASWQRAASAMLRAGVGDYASDVEARLGAGAAHLALDWLASPDHPGRTLPPDWARVVARHVGVLATRSSDKPQASLVSLLYDLGPSDAGLRSVPPSVWTSLPVQRGRSQLIFNAFLLSLGLYDAGGNGLPVVESVFQSVHDAAQSLPLQARRWIALHAPSRGLRIWENVSADEEARRALVRRALTYGWDAAALHRAARHKSTEKALAMTLKSVSGPRARALYDDFVGH